MIDEEELDVPDEDDEGYEKFEKNLKKRDALALRYIQQGVGKTIFLRIFGVKKAQDAWVILKQEFQDKSKRQWYLDSGASNHMRSNKDMFVEINSDITSTVVLGDGSYQDAKGKRIIAVPTLGGNKKLITNVLYVPNISYNLLSI
ncbi:uncharacterized protein LOC124943649 [Impatiens glandulifera]|uniref:uncharacterized protein LOC124943649 n=1 Tax=Impatiens glandulifera TaxID=253017 RepID=UPI001FB04D3F|nr:uncharacterized protein LOC124943649 [Impatiens glandulifera]